MKEAPPQLNTKSPQGVHLETVYRTLLRMVAYLEETGYTEEQSDMNLRQVEVFQHPDPADPASDGCTSQG
jgi:hypothetical protein